MAYNPLIPVGSDAPKDSRPQMQANFDGISTLVNVDHVNFDLANQGMHSKVTLPVQAPAPALGANNGFYNFLHPTTNVNQTYTHNQILGGGTREVPMTASVLSVAAPVQGMTGWTYLPSGVAIRWDVSAVAGGAQTITLPALPGLAALTTIFSVMLTPVTAGLTVQVTGITNSTQFTVNSSGAGSIRVLTIGN